MGVRAALAAAAALALAAPAAAAPTETILVTSVTVAAVAHDLEPAGPSRGDRVVSHDHLLNAAPQFGRTTGAVVGSDSAVLTLTSAHAATVQGRAILPGGTITISGPVTPLAGGGLSVPVTGGSGAFAHVRGTLTVGPGKDHVLNTYRLSRPAGFLA